MKKLSLKNLNECSGGGTEFGGVILVTGLIKADGNLADAHFVYGPNAAAKGADTALYQITVRNGMNLPNVGIVTP